MAEKQDVGVLLLLIPKGLVNVNDNVITSLEQNKQTSLQLYPSHIQLILSNCYVPSHYTSLQFQDGIRSLHLIKECVLIFIKINIFKFLH